jgi:hypothetical protein
MRIPKRFNNIPFDPPSKGDFRLLNMVRSPHLGGDRQESPNFPRSGSVLATTRYVGRDSLVFASTDFLEWPLALWHRLGLHPMGVNIAL